MHPHPTAIKNYNLRIQLFWGVTLCSLVSGCRRFERLWYVQKEGLSSTICLTLEDKHTIPFETSVITQPTTQSHTPEEPKPQKQRCESL